MNVVDDNPQRARIVRPTRPPPLREARPEHKVMARLVEDALKRIREEWDLDEAAQELLLAANSWGVTPRPRCREFEERISDFRRHVASLAVDRSPGNREAVRLALDALQEELEEHLKRLNPFAFMGDRDYDDEVQRCRFAWARMEMTRWSWPLLYSCLAKEQEAEDSSLEAWRERAKRVCDNTVRVLARCCPKAPVPAPEEFRYPEQIASAQSLPLDVVHALLLEERVEKAIEQETEQLLEEVRRAQVAAD